MVKVVATQKGYFGGEIREQGASFSVPDELWKDEKRRPSWAKLDPSKAFGGKGDHDGDGSVGGSRKGGLVEDGDEAVTIPADWANLGAAEMKALAEKISGEKAPNKKEAAAVIAAYVEAHPPAEPFADAPEPETVENPAGNGVQAALGGPEPDWVAPGHIEPAAVDD